MDDEILFTITTQWKAAWWRIPILWLLDQPWKIQTTYVDCKIVSTGISNDADDVVFTMQLETPEGTQITIDRRDIS